MYNISNYNLLTSVIKSLCRSTNTNFVDLEISFDKDEQVGFINNKIFVGNPETLPLFMFRVVELYVNNFDKICGKEISSNDIQKFNVLNAIFNYFRYISEPVYGEKIKLEKPVAQRLYQQEFVWSIMKNIICPAYNKDINNCLVVLFGTPWIDISFFFEDEKKERYIVVNNDIGNEVVKQSSLLCDAIKLHDLCPNKIISEIEGTEVFEKIYGTAKLAFNEKDSLDFMNLLKVFSGSVEKIDRVLDNHDIKTAQYEGQSVGANMGSSWWFLGLIEKLLEPSRGSDWSTYKELDPFYRELQQKIDDKRKEAGREGLTYEALLRVNSGELNPKDIKLIENNLGSDRIW